VLPDGRGASPSRTRAALFLADVPAPHARPVADHGLLCCGEDQLEPEAVGLVDIAGDEVVREAASKAPRSVLVGA
jgi:hypothetical protein